MHKRWNKYIHHKCIINPRTMGWTVRRSNSGSGGEISAPVQTGHEAHPASCTMGTWSILWVRQMGCGVVHPPQPSAEVKERVELYIYSPSGPLWLFYSEIYVPLPLNLHRCKFTVPYLVLPNFHSKNFKLVWRKKWNKHIFGSMCRIILYDKTRNKIVYGVYDKKKLGKI